MAEEYVLTPGGYRPKSLVHKIEPGHVLRLAEGRLLEIHPSGKMLNDFGRIPLRPIGVPLMPGNVFLLPPDVLRPFELVPALGTGWIAYAGWTNSGQPISLFTTTWTVPPAPGTQSGQTIFLFNGIQNSTMIYQPVLQWGPSAAGGGNNWAVASWYADGQGGSAFYSTLVSVNPGDVLIGVMTLTGQSGNQFSYNCEFQGIANTGLTIQNVEELTWANETLEAYSLAACSDYPNTGRTRFQAINIQTGAVTPALNWAPVSAVTDCGQHAVVVSNANPGGEVDIYYIAAPVVTWAQPADIVYGTALGAAQLNATASEAGTFAYNPPAGACLPAGTQTLTATFTPSDPTHETVTKTVHLNVLQATPTLNWANPSDIVFGTPLDGTQLNAAASWVVCGSAVPVPGIFTYTPPAGTCLPAGPGQTLSVLFTPNDSLDYTLATASVPINVLKATPTLIWPNPSDIDHGTPLDNTQLNAAASWVLCGATVSVQGVYTYTPPAGTVLPIGLNQTLSVLFTPSDTADYNNATASVLINVLTGYPIVMSVTFSPTTLQQGDRVQVAVTLKNDSIHPHTTQGPDPGFEYSEGDTFQTKGFPSIAGAYRIGVDLEASPYKVADLYRWGFGHTLAPGESVSVNGYIRFHNSRENGQYYVAMIQEVNNVVQDHQGTTGITVERP